MIKVLMSQTLSGSQTVTVFRLQEGRHVHTCEHATTHSLQLVLVWLLKCHCCLTDICCLKELRYKQPVVQEYNLRIQDVSLFKKTFSWSSSASSNAGSANKCQSNRATIPRVLQREHFTVTWLQSTRISLTCSRSHASHPLFPGSLCWL